MPHLFLTSKHVFFIDVSDFGARKKKTIWNLTLPVQFSPPKSPRFARGGGDVEVSIWSAHYTSPLHVPATCRLNVHYTSFFCRCTMALQHNMTPRVSVPQNLAMFLKLCDHSKSLGMGSVYQLSRNKIAMHGGCLKKISSLRGSRSSHKLTLGHVTSLSGSEQKTNKNKCLKCKTYLREVLNHLLFVWYIALSSTLLFRHFPNGDYVCTASVI